MVDSFLRPRSVIAPPQGALTYTPKIVFLEDSSLAGLQAQVDATTGTQSIDADNYYVLEQVQYQVMTSKLGPGPDTIYTCMIWLTKAEKA